MPALRTLRRFFVQSTTMALIVLLGGLITSGLLTQMVSDNERRIANEAIDRYNRLSTSAVNAEVQRYVDIIRTVADAAGAFDQLTATKYLSMTDSLAEANLNGASGAVFVVPSKPGQVAETQALWRERGIPDLTLRPQAAATEHYFSIFARRLDGTAPTAPGNDASSSTPRSQR